MQPDIQEFFTHSIMKCVPKSYAQAEGEVKVTAAFLNNFGGDNVRFLARSFGNPGDHLGQQSNGYRWPFGPVAIIAPFNFPLEIPGEYNCCRLRLYRYCCHESNIHGH